MKKICLMMVSLLLPSFIWAQSSQISATTTNGIVMFSNVPTERIQATITDSRGQFVFNALDLQGKASKSLRKYNEASKEWTVAAIDKEGLLLINGQTNPDKIRPGNSLEAIYWKDQSGVYWCLASANNHDFTDPGQLDEIWKAEVRSLSGSGEHTLENHLSLMALPINIRYE